MSSVLEVDSAVVCYGPVTAVDNVSIKVDRGEIATVLGANGAGKTTLISAIAGILPLDSGVVRFQGRDVTATQVEDLVRAGISLSPEGRRVFADLTVRENLVLGGVTQKDRAAFARDLERINDLFPALRERADQPAKTLSGGQQQMLAIGRSIMSAPKLLLLDEPSLGLAPQIVAEIFKLIDELRKDGLTVLLVEQNAAEALALADRAYVLNCGECVFAGTADELSRSENLAEHYLGAEAAES